MLCCSDEGVLLSVLVAGEHNERWREEIGGSCHFTEDAWTRLLHHFIVCLFSGNCTEILWLTKVKNRVSITVLNFSVLSRVFPWVLTVLDLSAYHFYKVIIAYLCVYPTLFYWQQVIEVIIKVEGSLSRGIIKHLNKVNLLLKDAITLCM